MIAKEPAQRYQTPAELAEALAPWTQTPIDPPSVEELPPITPGASGRPGGYQLRPAADAVAQHADARPGQTGVVRRPSPGGAAGGK